jgi:hypothetical protein
MVERVELCRICKKKLEECRCRGRQEKQVFEY